MSAFIDWSRPVLESLGRSSGPHYFGDRVQASGAPSLALSVVVPCFNEEQGLDELLRRVRSACEAADLSSYEILLVDDGSRDATWRKMRTAAMSDPHVVAVGLARNHGHQVALSAGLRFTRGERIFILDADLQDPPELLKPMMEVMDRGADVVYGQRIARKGESVLKRLTSHVFYRLLDRLTDVTIPVDTGDFRLISRRVVDVLNAMPENNRFIRGMVSWVGFEQRAFPYVRDERFAGETKYPFSKMMRLAIDAITGFSIQPLRLASVFGLFFGAVGLIVLAYVILTWLLGSTVQGWTSLISVVLLLGSAQLIVLGFIGEYLGRLYLESKHRPSFVVREIVAQGDEDVETVEPLLWHAESA